MLKVTEDIPISLIRELDTFERLIAQAQELLPAHEFTLTKALTDLIEESLTRGWIYSASLQELVAAMDPRLADLSIDGLAQVFDFEEVQVWANSTRSMPTRSHGAVAMRNAAFLLIQLKAMGFRVDDAPLSSRMRPLLASKKVLVDREFYVFWRHRQLNEVRRSRLPSTVQSEAHGNAVYLSPDLKGPSAGTAMISGVGVRRAAEEIGNLIVD